MAYDMMTAILEINPSAEVTVVGNEYDTIEWLHGTAVISKADIVAKQAELKADYDSKEYQRNRKKEYPSWEEQMDILYHSGVDGLKTELKKTKDKYPKA